MRKGMRNGRERSDYLGAIDNAERDRVPSIRKEGIKVHLVRELYQEGSHGVDGPVAMRLCCEALCWQYLQL